MDISIAFIDADNSYTGFEISIGLIKDFLKKSGFTIFNIKLYDEHVTVSGPDPDRIFIQDDIPDSHYPLKRATALKKLLINLNANITDISYNFRDFPCYYHLLDSLPSKKTVLRFHMIPAPGRPSLQLINDIRTQEDMDLLKNLIYKTGICLVISESISKNLRHICGCPLDNRIKLIPNPVDISFFKDSSEFESINKEPYLFTSSRLEHLKGIDILLFAFADFIDAHPLYRLKIAGEGSSYHYIKGIIKTLGIEKKVDLMGWVGYDNIPELMKGCYFYVCPSRTEPFGRPLIEAMAASKSIVATNVDGIPYIIKRRINGLLTETDPSSLAKAMANLADNVKLRKTIEKRNKKEALKYDISSIGKRYAEFYLDLYRRDQ